MNALAKIQELLGGEDLTGPLHNERDIVRLIRRGVPKPREGCRSTTKRL